MRVDATGVGLAVGLGVLAALLSFAGSAAAAPSWGPPETVATAGLFSEPEVGIDSHGRMAVVYEDGDGDSRWIELAVREPGGRFEVVGPVGGGAEQPRIAVNPDGAIGIAALRDGRLHVTVLPPPGPESGRRAPGTDVALDQPGLAAARHSLTIDGDGAVTVAWSAGLPNPDRERPWPPWSAYAATVTPAGAAPIRRLGDEGCAPGDVAGHALGGAAITIGCAGEWSILRRPAGGDAFGAPEPIPALPVHSWVYASPPPARVAVGEDGEAVVWQAYDRTGGAKWSTPDIVTQYVVGSPAGGLGPPLELAAARGLYAHDMTMIGTADGTFAAWTTDGGAIGYASRPAGGAFGPAAELGWGGWPSAVGVAAAGPGAALVHWRDLGAPHREPPRTNRDADPASIRAAIVRGGRAVDRRRWRPGLTRANVSPTTFSADASGRAVGVWAQRCPGDFVAITAVVRDERGGRRRPPCLDRRGPRLRVATRRARLRGRRIAVGVRCGEPCRVAARWRVQRRGGGRPIARGRLRAPRGGPIPTGRALRLGLTPRAARRVRRSARDGTRIVVRLRVVARDRFGNRRVARRVLRVRG